MRLSNLADEVSTAPRLGHHVGIAVPARNEAGGISACLSALDRAAANVTTSKVAVLILVNNSSDGTLSIARNLTPEHLELHVADISFPDGLAHVGSARRAALDRCADRLPPEGVLMTTDADSCVAPDWIAANLLAIEAGADAVAGVVAFDEAAWATIPDRSSRMLEARLAGLHARMASIVDPRPHDPWPNHLWAWGASIAVTVAAYRAVGGLPIVPLAEDRALADTLERHDLRVRRSHAPVVYTSARRFGRAPGGLADLISSYASDPATPCDAALEPTDARLRRLVWRVRLRRAFSERGREAAVQMARRLGARPTDPSAGFGAWWHSIETTSARLRRRRISPADLSGEVGRAERVIAWLERCEAGRAGNPASARAGRPTI